MFTTSLPTDANTTGGPPLQSRNRERRVFAGTKNLYWYYFQRGCFKCGQGRKMENDTRKKRQIKSREQALRAIRVRHGTCLCFAHHTGGLRRFTIRHTGFPSHCGEVDLSFPAEILRSHSFQGLTGLKLKKNGNCYFEHEWEILLIETRLPHTENIIHIST